MKQSLFMIIRIIIVCLIWGIIYEFIIPIIYAIILSIPIIGHSIMADGLITMVCASIAWFFSTFILKSSFECYIVLALGVFYLIMLGVLIPLVSGGTPYFTWEFANIAFGSILGWFGAAKMYSIGENDGKGKETSLR